MGAQAEANGRASDQRFYVRIGRQEAPSTDGLVDPLALCGLTITGATILCAEPGMGKTYVAERIARAAEEQGMVVWRYDYAEYDHEACCKRIVRNSRRIDHQVKNSDDATRLVVFDGVAPGDEGEVLREARAVMRLVEYDYRVLICIRPEAEQLAEALPDAKVLRANDLLYRVEDESNQAFMQTHGIPQLVVARRLDSQTTPMGLSKDKPGLHYLTAMEDLVSSQLRPGICDEEWRLRLTMIALGHGSIDELVAVCGRCDREQATWMQRNTPLYGVDINSHSFCCAGISEWPVFTRVAATLQPALAREPELAARICGILCTRGDVRRSALLCKLCSSEHDVCQLACRWGVPYLQAGEVHLVATSLASASRLDVAEDNRAILSDVALTCIRGTARDVEVAKERLMRLCDGTTQEAQLHALVDMMVAARDLCRNPQILEVRALEGSRPMTDLSAAEHVGVLRLMLAGEFSEAYARMSNEIMLRRVDTLSEALLCMDLQVSVALSGGSMDGTERWLVEEAAAFVARLPAGRLRRYHAAIGPLGEVLMGGSKGMAELEDAAAQAERVGDILLQAVFLMAAAVGDVRTRTFSRAKVRATHAATLARTAGVPYLVSAADLVCALALAMLGESGSLEAYCLHRGRPKELLLLGSLAARAAGEAMHGPLYPEVALGTPCPRDALWALNTIAYDCGALSEEVRRLMPASWLELLKLARMRQAVAYEISPEDEAVDPQLVHSPERSSLVQGDQAELLPFMSSGQRVRVKVLGGFGVWLDGERIPDHYFERRRARDLVELLAVAPSHRLRRFQAVRAIWPEEDYYRGPRKLYEATGEARKLMGVRRGLNAVVSDRAQGSVGFDRSIVGCDVDDFEREAHQTLMEDRDDFWVLDHARQMCRLYAGGADAHIESLGDEAVGRLAELEELFVDGLVAAGEAALRLAKARLAVRYATDAYHLRDLREDAVILLAQSLRIAGRAAEVRELYQRFSRRLMEAKGVLPSLALRQVVEHALSDVSEALSA